MPRTGTSKDLFESYLQEWLWSQCYGDDPFGNISISPPCMKYAKMRKLIRSSYPVCTVRDLIVASCRKETKYTASTDGNELEEGKQGKKNYQRRDEGICTDFIFIRFNLKHLISRDLLKQRHIKNQERFIAQRFGVIVTPLSRD